MGSTGKSRKTCSCWWRSASHLLSETMRSIRLKRFLSLPNRGHHWNINPCFNYFGSQVNYPVKQARFILQQSQWRSSQHQPSTSSAMLLSPNQEERFATIDQLRESWYWPNSILLLVSFVFVISDILVLLALVFHLVESSPASLLPTPLITSSPVSVDALIRSSLPVCDQVAHPPAPDDRETYGLQCLHPLLLSASPNDGTLISIWLLDSALLCCAVLCRLIRTSSIWLRRPKSKFDKGSYSFSGNPDSKSNFFSKCVGDSEGKFNGDRKRAGNFRSNANRLFDLDCNRIRRNRKCDVTCCDWWSWLWPWNENPGVDRVDLF